MDIKTAKKALETLVNGTEAQQVMEAESLDDVRGWVDLDTTDFDPAGLVSVTLDGVTFCFQGETHEAKNFGAVGEASGMEPYNFEGEGFDFDDVINAADAKTLDWFQGLLNRCESIAEAAYLTEVQAND